MGKKHKKHKKHHTDRGSLLPGYGSTAAEGSTSVSHRAIQDQEMRVVVRLPQTLTGQQERFHQSPSDSRHDRMDEPVSELIVSIPYKLLHQSSQETEEPSPPEHRHHHKHKKHKKHKKYHHQPPSSDMTELGPHFKSSSHSSSKHTSFHQESPQTVAPIKVKVPKITTTDTVESQQLSVQPLGAQFQSSQLSTALGGGAVSHTPSQVHKHHKHKHHHSHHHKKSHVEGTFELNEQGQQQQRGDIHTRVVPSGKPRAHIYHHSLESSSSKQSQVLSSAAPPLVEEIQKPSAQESLLKDTSGHKHHKKKKKHRHSKSSHHHSQGPTQQAFVVPPHPFTQQHETKQVEPSKTAVPVFKDLPKHDSGSHKAVSKHTSKPSLDEHLPPTKKVRIGEMTVGLKTISTIKPPKPSTDSSGSSGVASSHDLARKPDMSADKAQFHLTPSIKTQPPKVETPKSLTPSHPSTIPESQQVIITDPPPPPTLPPPRTHLVPEARAPQVKLSKIALKFFLKNLHHLIQKRDIEGVFAEPVTDDIAPGYSQRIVNPMDLYTMATKIESDQYTSVNEFKSDFVLMCNNAMTYNAPETMYYSAAKRLLTMGLKSIAKETSLRPDILHGCTRAQSASPLPPSLPEFHLPAPTSHQLDYTSPFLCRLNITQLQSAQKISNTSTAGTPNISAVAQSEFINIDLSDLSEISDQSHLTKVVVGCEEEMNGGRESAEDILMQVEEVAEAFKENLDTNKPNTRFCFLNQNDEGKTMINFMNPDSGEIDSSKAVDLTVLSDHVRMGNNAATVLKTELPMMKATPVSYLMYGPFGSFAPTYDSSFATLSKMDSDVLLHTYGSEVGISYAHSLQQFVKGTGSFVSEMADAVLNGLTNGRHSKFVNTIKSTEDKDQEKTHKNTQDSKSSKEGSPSMDKSPSLSNQGSPVDKEEPMELSTTEDLKENEEIVPSVADKETGDSDMKTQVSRPSSVAPSEGGASSSSNSSSVESEINGSRRGSVVSLEDNGLVSREGSVMKDSEIETPTELKSEHDGSNSPIQSSQSDDIDAQLQHTSNLLTELQEQQNERLNLPPARSSDGHLLLPGPSHEESATAHDIRSELVSLTSQVQPRDIISVPTLHRAMGITIEESTDREDLKPNGD